MSRSGNTRPTPARPVRARALWAWNTIANYALTVRPFARARFMATIDGLSLRSLRFVHDYMITDPTAGRAPGWLVRAVEAELIRRSAAVRAVLGAP